MFHRKVPASLQNMEKSHHIRPHIGIRLEKGARVIGFDNLNDYYDVKLKEDRLKILRANENYTFIKGDLAAYRLTGSSTLSSVEKGTFSFPP